MKIRKIKEDDCTKDFKTGYKPFDYDRYGNRLDSAHYFERTKKGYEVYVITDEARVLALLCLQIRGGQMYISRVGVYEGYHGYGYMTRMLLYGRERMDELGIKIATARVRKRLIQVFEEDFDFTIVREGEDQHWGEYAYMKLEVG